MFNCEISLTNTKITITTINNKNLIRTGRIKYRTICSACHNKKDPRKRGPIGPPIWGSSKELLTAKVLKRKYPPGYKPKRKSKIMPPMPYLAKYIDALHAYLNSEIK